MQAFVFFPPLKHDCSVLQLCWISDAEVITNNEDGMEMFQQKSYT